MKKINKEFYQMNEQEKQVYPAPNEMTPEEVERNAMGIATRLRGRLDSAKKSK